MTLKMNKVTHSTLRAIAVGLFALLASYEVDVNRPSSMSVFSFREEIAISGIFVAIILEYFLSLKTATFTISCIFLTAIFHSIFVATFTNLESFFVALVRNLIGHAAGLVWTSPRVLLSSIGLYLVLKLGIDRFKPYK